jgi:hypothetical protein
MDLHTVRPADLWYVVGLIATDGCISRDGRHINITSACRQHLETVRLVLGFKIAIGEKRNGSRASVSYYQIQIGSRNLVRFLTAIGLTPRKSLTIGPLDVPADAFPDLLRGVIDGDGCIRTWIHSGNGVPQWALKISTASPAFAARLRSRIEERFRVKGAVHQKRTGRKHPLHDVKFGKLAMKIVLRACYYSGAVALEGKRDLALECLRSVNKHRWYHDVIPRPESNRIRDGQVAK